jgi:hypothetical protein
VLLADAARQDAFAALFDYGGDHVPLGCADRDLAAVLAFPW